MKKSILYIIIFTLAFFLNSCDNYLTVEPESDYSTDGAYKTQTDFQQAIAAVYSQQQALYQSYLCWFRGTIGRCDDTRSGTQYLYGVDTFTNDAANPWSLNGWQLFWKIISQANIILEKIDAVEFTDPVMKNSIKGEAYILRAYGYWNLANQYGGMPLIERTLTVEAIKKIARSTMNETLAFATSDYKKAIDLLPEEWNSANKGRATKYAAEGMLARLYLFQRDYTSAKPLLKDIISSGLYAMESSYINCFTDSKDNGPERVWEVQFTGGQLGEGQSFSGGCLPEGFDDTRVSPFSGFTSAMLVSDTLYNAYEPGDIRKNLSILKGWVSNTGVVDKVSKYVVKYTHYDTYTPKDQYDWANNIPILRYTDVKMMYAEVLNEEGYVANGEAFDILNEVRIRAGIPSLTATDLPDKESFWEAIIRERRVEFAFEGLRWVDLIRWGIAQQIMNEFLSLPSEGGGLYSMKEYHKLLAIPYEEISRYNDESVMWQNPGY
jgi:starch-binding outer membrane protein, SusD/RagB family